MTACNDTFVLAQCVTHLDAAGRGGSVNIVIIDDYLSNQSQATPMNGYDARSAMSDSSGGNITTVAGTGAEGGLIDVSGLKFNELSAAISGIDLGHALDYIVFTGQNGNEYYGFNSSI